jgi:hypothetical protein
MDYKELLFAAEVRKLATEMRNGDWSDYSAHPDVIAIRPNRIAYREHREAWTAENPIEPYLLRAVVLIRDTADFIHQLPPE